MSNTIINRTISDFMDKEYKSFAKFVIESRAFPSVVDGFKPTQRKVIYVASKIWKNVNEKPLKVFQLSGRAAAEAFYHSGNVSMDNAIINMAQKFKNNLPLLEEIGQFGSLRSPEPGAARYIGTKLNKNFSLLYKDSELLENMEEEGNIIEPRFYLPIIPTVLVNGGSGIAVGFSTNILNRDPLELINYVKARLLKKNYKGTINPKVNTFNGEFIQDTENHKKWYIRGKFERLNANTIKISEIPPSYTLEKYESILDDLVSNKTIQSYEDNCSDRIEYLVKVSRDTMSNLTDEKLIKTFKLEESETENFGTLDENGKLLIFDKVEDLIEYFVKFRLSYYDKRKTNLTLLIKEDIQSMSDKMVFITSIVNKKLSVSNVPIAEIESNIESKLKLRKIEGSYNHLLRLPISQLTKEMVDKLEKEISERKKELEILNTKSSTDLYLTDLEELNKILVKNA